MFAVIHSILQTSAIGFLAYVVGLLICYRVTLPAYLKFKRRKEGYGTVFNSYTGEPIDLARIRLADEHGLTTGTAVTDSHGRYRLIVAPGEYVVDVTKAGFEFPSVFMNDAFHSSKYDNIIPSRRIRIKDHGIMTKNIPVDPVRRPRHSTVFRKWPMLGENAQFAIAWSSPFIALVYPFLNPLSIPLWVVATIYAAAMGRRFLTFKPGRGAYGTIRNATTHAPIDHVVVRLFDSKQNKILQTITTSETGRYAFLVNAGSYYILLKKDGYKPIRLNFPNITKDGYALATEVRMTPTVS